MTSDEPVRIAVLLGRERLFSFTLGTAACSIGRSGSCDVVLPLPEISRIHAVVERRGGAILIEDRSRNGILHGGRPVRSARVELGEEVRIAAYTLRFEPLREASGPTPSDTAETTDAFLPSTAPAGLGEMVGGSEPMLRVYQQVRSLARSSVPVLILGETGTGKELVARALHSLGPNGSKPWVAVNCAAISPDLVESELFGHERGAFTGAHRQRDGAFVAAAGGTLFLDEVGELPPAIQPKLLRVLEDSEILRVGGREPVRVSARIIAATNRNLADDVTQGRFRSDLYYRLCVIPVSLPPLRERGDDVVLLARHFLAEEHHERLELSPEALDVLRAYAWPGNARELRNLARRLIARDESGPVGADTIREALEADRRHHAPPLPGPPVPAGVDRAPDGDARTLREIERVAILRTLEDCRGNKQATARRLGIAPATLYEKIKRYGL